ncbi:hypothetical protein A2707_02325 [Candidatus Saccharibacteria bacterium RIFCSPHIGHO2_01_FULL_45_15]|nr:MAG: hypothetical protein A2707_02325 [Candidatus Saccharibacteria bacterium RIFCSPHIGHO2_01_FULL_45_15]OGL28737.1 MAG: hypothetical protein A3C39_00160 [Candidatus Saccharibacteria bacterium RIFCSPHIGHO2_02_FULL_46_12]OGL32560.1 MAG: hypothetical protein A3E76_06395 [Candidatus Saccharibacteria bacterium RIFCSPHIGHO2_12_FULL_44_22]
MNSNESWIEKNIGIVIAGAVIIFIGWALISSSSQTNSASTEDYSTVESAVDEINAKIGSTYKTGEETYYKVEEECVWQEENLSGNIGTVCGNNAHDPYTEDYRYPSPEVDVSSYTTMLDDGSTVEEVINKLVEDSNSKYNEVLSKVNNMVSALDDQCDWVASNIDDEIGDHCYDTTSEFKSGDYQESPFTASEYI